MFDIVKPCDDCPFRREGGIRLVPQRAQEIADMMLSDQGGTFMCHKTATSDIGDDGEGVVRGERPQHCAGALIFAEKNGNATQAMRIAERLRLYDPLKVMAGDGQDEIFDSRAEMLAAQDAR